MEFPEKIKKAIEAFTNLPGIGEKSALRQVLQMTKWSDEKIQFFSESMNALTTLQKCSKCGIFADESLCNICSDPVRSKSPTLCIVEEMTDCLAIEKSGSFPGKYHILGGVLNPLLGIGPDDLKLNELRQRIIDEGVDEVILALNPSVEGDATCSFLKEMMPPNVKIDRIGFGIPIGGSLEYLDSLTISKALENKKLM